MKVAVAMRTRLLEVPPDTSFDALLRMLLSQQMRRIYVVDAGRVVKGVVTSLDLLKAMIPFYLDSTLARAVDNGEELVRSRYEENKSKTAAELMTTRIISLRPEDTVVEADALLREHGFNALPVLDEHGALLGEINRRVVLRTLAAQCLPLDLAPEK